MYAKNGGVVGYEDRDDSRGSKTDRTYSIKGFEKISETFEIEIDFQQPSHCYETRASCSDDALSTNGDFLTEVDLYSFLM